jgi:hypothetical protein
MRGNHVLWIWTMMRCPLRKSSTQMIVYHTSQQPHDYLTADEVVAKLPSVAPRGRGTEGQKVQKRHVSLILAPSAPKSGERSELT